MRPLLYEISKDGLYELLDDIASGVLTAHSEGRAMDLATELGATLWRCGQTEALETIEVLLGEWE